MRPSTLLTALTLTTFTFAAAAYSADSANDFVKNASIGGEFEIESSKLALKRSGDGDVKQFAQQMIDDHSKIDDQMKVALHSSNADPSQATTTLDSKHQKMLDNLNSASDSDFNSQYIKEQKAAHKEAVKLFSSYSKNGDDASLKGFATKELPLLKEHQQHAEQLKVS